MAGSGTGRREEDSIVSSSARAVKAELRRQLQDDLASLDASWAEDAAQRIAKRLLDLPEMRSARRVLTCLSFGREVDIWGLVEELLASGREVYVPRAEPATRELRIHPYPCALTTLSFGLRQPSPGEPELYPSEVSAGLDVALVLGLAFDRRGIRLGYGGGYFDRFLRQRPFPAIGLAFQMQLRAALPREPHDIPMSLVVTEEEVLRPAATGPSMP